ncbi:MAG: serpin family protein [Bacteroidales bacterium]|nr:serpin family protein [Bacteroidales bacterium]
MKSLYILAASSLLFCAAACSQTGAEGDNPYKALTLSTKGAEFVQKGTSFTFEYIDRINTESKVDYIISPLSMQFLLGMILDGAQGDTAAEICSVLGYGKGETAVVNDYCLSMLKQLPQMDKKTKLNIASAIFVDEGWPLLDSYKADVGKYYLAEVSNLDFSNGPASLKAINGWCSKHTEGLVPKILDEVREDMLAYLLNALYFKSQWSEKFSKSLTADEPFTDESGAKGIVKMMKQEKTFSYTENDIFQAVTIPYGNGAFSMTVLLPAGSHKVADICAFLKKTSWDVFRHSMDVCEVDLWLPKFETKYHIKLNDILSDMGMPRSFDEALADFKAMSNYALCLSFVQQDAVIKVDEEGTEAAVVSSAGMLKETAFMPGEHVVLHADHPFLYLISESSTGAVLFAGRFAGKSN